MATASLSRVGDAPVSSLRLVVLGGLGVVAFFASVAAPLLTYGTTLALFGLAHVATELRYVDHRFGPRIGRRTLLVLVGLLISVAGLRASRVAGLAGPNVAATLELVLGVGLCATVLPLLIRAGVARAALGIGALAALVTGIALSPALALLALAVAHNVTPVGFLAEALRGRVRTWAMVACAAVFVAIPALIVSGEPVAWLAARGWIALEASWLPVGPLAGQFSAYLPRAWHLEVWALHAFSAVVFLQCAHYLVVIGVLPRLHDDHAETALPWPSRRTFAWMVVAASVCLFAFYAVDFGLARAVYGIPAAVHAWIEIPLLLLALAPPRVEAS